MEDRDLINWLKSNLRSNFLMKVTSLQKTGNEEETKMKVVNEDWLKIKRADFIRSYISELNKGIKRKIEFVNKQPDNFQIGVLYILKDGKRLWTTKIVEE